MELFMSDEFSCSITRERFITWSETLWNWLILSSYYWLLWGVNLCLSPTLCPDDGRSYSWLLCLDLLSLARSILYSFCFFYRYLFELCFESLLSLDADVFWRGVCLSSSLMATSSSAKMPLVQSMIDSSRLWKFMWTAATAFLFLGFFELFVL